RLVNIKIDHSISLRPEYSLEVVRRDDFVVIGKVGPCGGVVKAADVLGQPVKGLVRHMFRRLEHHVLEHMRKARTAGWVVLSAHVIPYMYRDGGGRRVPMRDDPHAVCERSFLYLERCYLKLGGGIKAQKHHHRSGRKC